MIKILGRFKYFFKKPCLILVIGKGSSFSANLISKMLNTKVYNSDLLNSKQVEKFKSLLNKSKQPILVINDVSGKREIAKAKQIAKSLPYYGYLVLNSDNEKIRELSEARVLTYGFQKKSDLQVSSINVDEDGTNFKVDYSGNSVPFWFREALKRKQVYYILSAILVGIVKEINLIFISESLK